MVTQTSQKEPAAEGVALKIPMRIIDSLINYYCLMVRGSWLKEARPGSRGRRGGGGGLGGWGRRLQGPGRAPLSHEPLTIDSPFIE